MKKNKRKTFSSPHIADLSLQSFRIVILYESSKISWQYILFLTEGNLLIFFLTYFFNNIYPQTNHQNVTFFFF